MPRSLVIQTEDLAAEAAQWLAERCEVVRRGPDEHGFEELLGRADALVIRTYTKVNAAMLDKAPRLKVVGRAGVGLENVDVAACRARGIEVVHTPGANTRAVVEFVAAVMLDALRPRMQLIQPLDSEHWHQIRREFVARRELNELVLGVYGLGRIGSQVARLGGALDMRVIYHDLREIAAADRFGAEPVDREALLEQSDVLSIHVDGRAGNRNLLDAAAFARLKPSAVFINTSRGFVVDAGALAEFLRQHPWAQALIDVHDPDEPFGAAYPLLNLGNARLYPHLASGSATAKLNMSWVVRDVWRVLRGERPDWRASEP